MNGDDTILLADNLDSLQKLLDKVNEVITKSTVINRKARNATKGSN